MGDSREVAKRPYRNNTAGWLGVVKLDHLGAQIGHPVEPLGTVWLSDDEAKLTARAPADPAKNPFVEQTFQFVDEQGQQVGAQMRPLVLIEDEREVPAENDRYVPDAVSDAQSAAAADAQRALAGDSERDTEIAAGPSGTPVPLMATPASTSPGVLRGSNEPVPEAPQGDVVAEGTPGAAPPPQAPAPASVASSEPPVVEEETAAELPSGEETGAAETPTGAAPEGEYAQHEEVGTPEAPAQEDDE